MNRRNFARHTMGTALAGLLVAASLSTPAAAQGYTYNPEHRRPVEATIQDLQQIGARNTYNGHERERYDNAIRHLGEFSARLHEGGFFDKGKLDQAIGDVQNVLDRNPMHQHARDMLNRDAMELRRLRQHFDDRYHYPY